MKKILLLFLGLVICISMTACNNEKEPTKKPIMHRHKKNPLKQHSVLTKLRYLMI